MLRRTTTADDLGRALWDQERRLHPQRQQVAGGERDVSALSWEELRALGGESGGTFGSMLARAQELLREASAGYEMPPL